MFDLADALPERPGSIGGWLLVFAIWLILGSLFSVLVGLATLPPGVLSLGLGLLGIYVAVAVIRVQPQAARLAVHFLTVVAILGLILTVAAMAAGAREAVALGPVVSSVLWITYFYESRRVGATFGFGKWASLHALSGEAAWPRAGEEAAEPEPPLRFDAWEGGPVRKCPACGLANVENAFHCQECGESLEGTVPFMPEDAAVPPPAGP